MSRRTPYTKAGLRRMACYRCSAKPATTDWQVCSDGNTYRPLCTDCDIALNALVLRWMHHPDAEILIERYIERQKPTDGPAVALLLDGPRTGFHTRSRNRR